MVKPSKRMQPESVELTKAGRASNAAFQDDSFAHYMARKIDGQRKDKGCVLPPDPRLTNNNAKEVRFAPDVVIKERKKTGGRKREGFGIHGVVKRLKASHGYGLIGRRKKKDKENDALLLSNDASEEQKLLHNESLETQVQPTTTLAMPASSLHASRPDLFFVGIVIMVNGYTDPDVETLNRLMHKHGGDLEKYETSRVTHIIAERLSTAKANVYKQRKQPTPVCKPSWIVDCVSAHKLLPYQDYLIDCVKSDNRAKVSLRKYFVKEPVNKTVAQTDQSEDFSDDKLLVDSSSGLLRVGAEQPGGDNGSSPEPHPRDSGHDTTDKSRLQMGQTDNKYIQGRIRTIGTDPNFLDSFFNASRLSFIGSFKQRAKVSPTKKREALSTKHTRRFVLHIDMDSFFCSVVLRNYPQYNNKPVVISHHGKDESKIPSAGNAPAGRESTSECATCNYEARKFGVKKGMYLGQAMQLCSDLVVLPYDFEGYETVSEQVSEILYRNASQIDGNVEQVSCDEFYLEVFVDLDDLLSVEALGRTIRHEIYEETRCTASIGIGENKLLAKLATDKVKPDGLLLVRDYRDLLQSLKLRDLYGIGYRLEQKLADEGFESVLDVWASSKDELVRILGKGLGSKLFDTCYGKDDRPVEPAERKSIGAECNYGVRFNGPYGPEHALECLAKEIEKRMSIVGVRGTKVTLKVKERKEGAPPPPKFLGHGSCNNLSKSSLTPNSVPTRDFEVIRTICTAMYSQLSVRKEDVRGIGIVITNLKQDDSSNTLASEPERSVKSFFASRSTKTTCTVQELDTAEAHDFSESPGNEVVELIDSTQGSAIIRKPTHTYVIDDIRAHSAEHFEIDLPSLSQLHMSQVDSLPSPMRRQAMRKINDIKARNNGDFAVSRIPQPVAEQTEQCLKQTNVKRLFKLAAVKAGQAPLDDITGGPISLSDLESLPLKMQLQLANNDCFGLGVASKPHRHSKQSTREGTSYKQSRPKSPLSMKNDARVVDQGVRSAVFEKLDSDLLFRDDLFPFGVFLDENPPDNNTIQLVCEFLSICVTENRLHDVSLLFRSLRNRSDQWSNKEALDQVLLQIDGVVFEKYRKRLDKDWLCR